MIALFIPWVLIALLLFVIALFFKRRWKVASLLFILVFIINYLYECFPLNYQLSNTVSEGKRLKIICFNFDGSTGDIKEKACKVDSFLLKYKPDIVFLAEFSERASKQQDSILRKGFPYTTYTNNLYFHYFYGKYPFFHNKRLRGKDVEYGVYFCNTVFDGDTIDLYGCHLASNNYNEKNQRIPIEEFDYRKGAFEYLKNIKAAGLIREIEVDAIIKEMSKSNHRVILLGDFNDICGSKTLRNIENAGLKDAWWERGTGYGATIKHPIPFRIDHILFSKGLKLEKIMVLDSNGISDHDALCAEFSIVK